jgi:hypothetical protein
MSVKKVEKSSRKKLTEYYSILHYHHEQGNPSAGQGDLPEEFIVTH